MAPDDNRGVVLQVLPGKNTPFGVFLDFLAARGLARCQIPNSGLRVSRIWFFPGYGLAQLAYTRSQAGREDRNRENRAFGSRGGANQEKYGHFGLRTGPRTVSYGQIGQNTGKSGAKPDERCIPGLKAIWHTEALEI